MKGGGSALRNGVWWCATEAQNATPDGFVEVGLDLERVVAALRSKPLMNAALEILLREERGGRAAYDGLVGSAVPVADRRADGPVSWRGADDVELRRKLVHLRSERHDLLK